MKWVLPDKVEENDECNLSLRELIKAFSKLIYITLYGFKNAPPDVLKSKEGQSTTRDKTNV